MRQALNRRVMRAPIWPLYLLGYVPAAVVFARALTGNLGPEPINVLERELGEWALRFLVIGLAVTPLRRLFGITMLRFRRALGLLAFGYAVLHLASYLMFDQAFDWAMIWKDILKRPYITVGVAAFALLLPMALTSNAASIRALGPRWHTLHWLVYPASVLAATHYVMLVKTWQAEPLVYLGIIVLLLMARLMPARR